MDHESRAPHVADVPDDRRRRWHGDWAHLPVDRRHGDNGRRFRSCRSALFKQGFCEGALRIPSSPRTSSRRGQSCRSRCDEIARGTGRQSNNGRRFCRRRQGRNRRLAGESRARQPAVRYDHGVLSRCISQVWQAGKSTDASRVEHLKRIHLTCASQRRPTSMQGYAQAASRCLRSRICSSSKTRRRRRHYFAHLGPEDVKHLLAALATPKSAGGLNRWLSRDWGNQHEMRHI